jgi:hypothetical protein
MEIVILYSGYKSYSFEKELFENNEVYIADGYLNKRVIVFDAETGEYKRHWGVYGNKPEDVESDSYSSNNISPEHFSVVHSVRISEDGLVYVCDRGNNRIQVFQKDGKFLFEEFVAKDTPGDMVQHGIRIFPQIPGRDLYMLLMALISVSGYLNVKL